MPTKCGLTCWRFITGIAILVIVAVSASVWSGLVPHQLDVRKTSPKRLIVTALPQNEVLQDCDANVIGDRLLTVEETIGLVFNGEGYMVLRANPAAKSELYLMLDEYVEDMGHHCVIIGIIGYIGNGQDAVILKERLMNYRGILNQSLRCHAGAAVAILDALGVMARRGIPEASAFLNEMLEPGYWQNTFQWDLEELRIKNSIPNALESVVRTVWACAVAGREDLSEIRETVLGQITDPTMRQRVEDRLNIRFMKLYAEEVFRREATVPTKEEYKKLQYGYSLKESIMAGIRRLSESELKNRRNTLLDPNWTPNGRETRAFSDVEQD